jgi:hypothetical protein
VLSCRVSSCMDGRAGAPDGLALAQFALAPAWATLADPANESLSWRRAACNEPEGCAPSELAAGGLLKLLQSEQSLTVPKGTRGGVSAYANSTGELSAAVREHLRATRDPYYAEPPLRTQNYGGRGSSQQLWWCGADKGWRVTEPNVKTRKGAGGKRRKTYDGPAPSDIQLLPVLDTTGATGSEELGTEVMRLQDLLDTCSSPSLSVVAPAAYDGEEPLRSEEDGDDGDDAETTDNPVSAGKLGDITNDGLPSTPVLTPVPSGGVAEPARVAGWRGKTEDQKLVAEESALSSSSDTPPAPAAKALVRGYGEGGMLKHGLLQRSRPAIPAGDPSRRVIPVEVHIGTSGMAWFAGSDDTEDLSSTRYRVEIPAEVTEPSLANANMKAVPKSEWLRVGEEIVSLQIRGGRGGERVRFDRGWCSLNSHAGLDKPILTVLQEGVARPPDPLRLNANQGHAAEFPKHLAPEQLVSASHWVPSDTDGLAHGFEVISTETQNRLDAKAPPEDSTEVAELPPKIALEAAWGERTARGRSYKFLTTSAEERDAWIAAISEVAVAPAVAHGAREAQPGRERVMSLANALDDDKVLRSWAQCFWVASLVSVLVFGLTWLFQDPGCGSEVGSCSQCNDQTSCVWHSTPCADDTEYFAAYVAGGSDPGCSDGPYSLPYYQLAGATGDPNVDGAYGTVEATDGCGGVPMYMFQPTATYESDEHRASLQQDGCNSPRRMDDPDRCEKLLLYRGESGAWHVGSNERRADCSAALAYASRPLNDGQSPGPPDDDQKYGAWSDAALFATAASALSLSDPQQNAADSLESGASTFGTVLLYVCLCCISPVLVGVVVYVTRALFGSPESNKEKEAARAEKQREHIYFTESREASERRAASTDTGATAAKHLRAGPGRTH